MGRRHIYAYDFIRAIAIIMVVAVHCIPGRAETSAAHFTTLCFKQHYSLAMSCSLS